MTIVLGHNQDNEFETYQWEYTTLERISQAIIGELNKPLHGRKTNAVSETAKIVKVFTGHPFVFTVMYKLTGLGYINAFHLDITNKKLGITEQFIAYPHSILFLSETDTVEVVYHLILDLRSAIFSSASPKVDTSVAQRELGKA